MSSSQSPSAYSYAPPRRPADALRGWSLPQRVLHWATALCIVFAFSISWIMVALPRQQLLLKFSLFQAHKTAGILVILFVLTRLVLRTLHERPPEDDVPRWQRRAAGLMHVLLYALAAITPLLGYFMAATSRAPTLFFGILPIPSITGPNPEWSAWLVPIHRTAAIVLVTLAFAHALAAIYNHLRGRVTLVRMWRGTPQAAAPSETM